MPNADYRGLWVGLRGVVSRYEQAHVSDRSCFVLPNVALVIIGHPYVGHGQFFGYAGTVSHGDLTSNSPKGRGPKACFCMGPSGSQRLFFPVQQHPCTPNASVVAIVEQCVVRPGHIAAGNRGKVLVAKKAAAEVEGLALLGNARAVLIVGRRIGEASIEPPHQEIRDALGNSVFRRVWREAADD